MSQDIHNLFDGDPEVTFEYHQDYREADHLSLYLYARYIIPAILFILTTLYQLGYLADYNILSIPELMWNCFVYLTPMRLIDSIDMYQSPLRVMNPALKNAPRTLAWKSEALRRILGLDTSGGIISTVADAGRRRMSIIPGLNVVVGKVIDQPPGLGNWDNSCYQNSVLQGLASLDSLSEYLTNPDVEDGITEGAAEPAMKMAESLRGLIATLNDPENNGQRIWTPATLKNMSSWQQQDAQEYFSKVLDEIDKEVSKVAHIVKKSPGFESDDSAISNPDSMRFRNPLEGLIAQRVGCTSCGYSEDLSMIPFNCLTVPLGRARECGISECLDEYTNLEEIEGVECGRCTLLKTQKLYSKLKERNQDSPNSAVYRNVSERLAFITEALEDDDYAEKTLSQKCMITPKNRVSSTKTRQAVIARPPKSLVVHFNRSVFNEMTGELSKNTAQVRFPKALDLGPWCLGSSGSIKDPATEEWLLNPSEPMIASSRSISRVHGPIYELRAVVTHYGRHENGHYICYRKHPIPSLEEDKNSETQLKQQWWRLSDDDVMKVSEESVLAQGGVFMLFFDLVENASPSSIITPSLGVNSNLETHIAHKTELKIESVPASNFGSLSDSRLASQLPNAVNLPLQDVHDSELPENEDQALSVSEFDEDDNDLDDPNESNSYAPTKAIILTQSVLEPNINSEDETSGKPNILSNGNLLMV